MSSKLTPEEEKALQKELPAVLEEHGANNKSKANYVKSISESVIGSTNPKFYSMQPRVKDNSKSEPYKAAYLIVFNYLDEFKFNYTKEVMLKEMEQNKVQKPPLPSVPSGYGTTDINEIFSFTTISEIACNNTFEENVEEFVINCLHEQPSQQSPQQSSQPAAKPLNQSPVNSDGAFLTQSNTQHVENKPTDNSKDDGSDIEIIDDFNDDYDKEENNQNKSGEKGSNQEDEVIDIDEIDSEGEDEGEDKKDGQENDVDDFNEDVEDFIDDVDDNDEGNKADSNDHKNESDAQNNSMSISINSDNFEMDFDD